MKVVRPPEVIDHVFSKIAEDCTDKLEEYLEFLSPVDKKGRYLPYAELQYRVPEGLNLSYVWSIVKHVRRQQWSSLIGLGGLPNQCGFVLTPMIQKAISETDRGATSAALEWINNKIGETKNVEYLLNDLIEDESISSSQLEGAATTTRVAKRMLKSRRKPRNGDERMILGNYQMMSLAWSERNKPLSLELLRKLHEVGVEGINDAEYTPGVFRKNNEVHVVDKEGNIVYTPPPAEDLKSRLKRLAEWVNADHDVSSAKTYLHPLIKAMVLHFAIGYEHPFHDGNGRVARALFYWFLFKKDFEAFRYISISVLLKRAPAKYGKSYLCTEHDDMDLTYFIEYQCGVVVRAIEKFKSAHQNAAKEIEKFNHWLWKSGLYKELNDKQRMIFQVAKAYENHSFTIREVESNLNCSYNTASSVLNGLVKLGLFRKEKSGREWHFTIKNKEKIMEL